MSLNDLNKPLHQKARARAASRRRALIAPVLIGAALAVALIAAFWIAVVDDPEGGRAVAVAPIEDAVPAATGSLATEEAPAPQETAGTETQLAALPAIPPTIGADPSLVEQSAFGPLPRIAPDGRRPRDVYARRSATVPSGVPRVVIVVGGLGLSQTATQFAIDTLPEDVTLAFAPYGSSLQRWMKRARDAYHEVILQVPMEPNGDAQGHPGEHTLLASDGANNRENLHWVMSRVAGYVGVMNHMGARFTAEETALLPFLGEVGERGLFYLDDGSSPRSRAAEIGEALRVPVLTADRILDRSRAPADIQTELAALEATARTRGLAIGVASAFPASVEAIAEWATQAQDRGIFLVPASAAIDS